MTNLYLAQNPITHAHLLVKVLLPEYQKDPIAQKRLKNEAFLLKRCHHPNIISLDTHGTHKGTPFLSFPFLRGTTLRKAIDHHPLPLKKALSLLIDLCSALSYLHSIGYAHRDIKPENIFITEEGHALLIDFGLSCPLESKETPFQQEALFEGSPFYMSPEAMKNHAISTKERDIYALGMVAYEMILGKITHGRVLLSFLPKGLQAYIGKALYPDPTKRYKTAEDFGSALKIYLESRELEQERHGIDYFFDLFEQFSTLQRNLLSTVQPHEDSSSSLAHLCPINRKGLYCATFKEGMNRGFVAVEFKQKGLHGLLAGYLFHVYMAENHDLPLYERCRHAQVKLQEFCPSKISYAFVDDMTHLAQVFIQEEGLLIRIQDEQPYSTLVSGEWELQTNERLVFLGFHPSIQREELQEALDRVSSTPCAQQAQQILQNLQIKRAWPEDEHPVCVVVLFV